MQKIQQKKFRSKTASDSFFGVVFNFKKINKPFNKEM